MPKLMVLHGLPRAGAYRPPPGRVIPLGQLRGLNGYEVRNAIAGARLYGHGGGLGGLSGYGLAGAAADRARAESVGGALRNTCRSLCGLIVNSDPVRLTIERTQCLSGCDAAFFAAMAAVAAAIPDDADPGDPTSDIYATQIAEIERLRAEQAARTGDDTSKSTADEEKILGLPKNVVYVGGVVLAGLGAYVLLRKRR